MGSSRLRSRQLDGLGSGGQFETHIRIERMELRQEFFMKEDFPLL